MFVNLANFASPIFYRLLFMSTTAAIVGIVIMLIRQLTDKKFSPFWKYAMWFLVFAALVIPWRPQSNFAIINNVETIQSISFRNEFYQSKDYYEVIKGEFNQYEHDICSTGIEIYSYQNIKQQGMDSLSLANIRKLYTMQDNLNTARTKSNQLHIKMIIFDYILPLICLCGSILIALFMISCKIHLKYNIKKSEIVPETSRYDDILLQCKKKLGMKLQVRIIIQSHVRTPALFGLLNPKIILPEYVESLNDKHLEHIILHELSHLKRGDSIVSTLLLILQTVYWFNPLTWLLFKFVREDMELANDAAVLKDMSAAEQKEYGLSIVVVLASYGKQTLMPRLLYMVDNEKNMTRRINMIKLSVFFRKRRLTIAICALSIIAGTAILFLTTSGVKAQTPTSTSVPSTPYKAYYLENATEREKMEQMRSITLYDNGSAELAIPPISSLFIADPLYYSFVDNKLQIYVNAKNDNIIATFEVIDDNTLLFLSSTVPLFADSGKQYVYTPFEGTISIAIEMGTDGKPWYSLFDYEPTNSFEYFSIVHIYFQDIESLNLTLREYTQDSIKKVYVTHTDEFTKEEIEQILEKIIIPSKNYSMSASQMDSMDETALTSE